MPVKLSTNITLSHNAAQVFAFTDRVNKKFLRQRLPRVKELCVEEAQASMDSERRPGSRPYGSGGAPGLRDEANYRVNERSHGRGKNVGSVVSLADYSIYVYKGRGAISNTYMTWNDPSGRKAEAENVRARGGNPWMGRALARAAQEDLFTDIISFGGL